MSIPALVLVGFLLFCLGIFGVLARRNFIVVLLSIELIFAGAGLNFVAFSNLWQNLTGQVFTVFLIAVAAGEAAVGLGLLIALYRVKHTANVDEARELKG
ncbi:MAG: NADH-quinone oxidoreductase subunit NuoK [Acidobacteriota bacterium]